MSFLPQTTDQTKEPARVPRQWLGLFIAFVLVMGADISALAEWKPEAETLVVYNKNYPESESLARYYAEKRHIPAEHLFALDASKEEAITREEFDRDIRGPLRKHLLDKGWFVLGMKDWLDPKTMKPVPRRTVLHQEIRVLVLIRGVPLKVKRSNDDPKLPAMQGNEASVDSELMVVSSENFPIAAPLGNKFYQSTERLPEHIRNNGGVIVGRLDAPDEATVRRMIDDTLRAEREGLWGRAVIDYCKIPGAYEEGDKWLAETAKIYREAGIPALADTDQGVFREHWPLPDTILYFGWYEGGIKGALASPEFRFKPGAIACHLHSFSADTLRSKTSNWCAPMLDHGAAAVIGNVWEPYLTLTTHFDLFNERLLMGFTLGEAMWAATPAISWMNVLVGDPLYVPFPKLRRFREYKPEDKDYVDYHSLVLKHLPDLEKKLLPELVTRGEKERNGRMIELAGLLSQLDDRKGAADDYYQHAKSIYKDPRDQLRCALYGMEILFRQGNEKLLPVRAVEIRAEATYREIPALESLPAISPEPPPPAK